MKKKKKKRSGKRSGGRQVADAAALARVHSVPAQREEAAAVALLAASNVRGKNASSNLGLVRVGLTASLCRPSGDTGQEAPIFYIVAVT